MGDIPKIKLLLREAADFRHPAELAKVVAQNMLKNKIDISLEVVSVLVDVKGQSWQHLGEDVGKILAKIIVSEEAPELAALASSEPEEEWPWHPKTTTAVPAQGAHDFEEGLAAGLG